MKTLVLSLLSEVATMNRVMNDDHNIGALPTQPQHFRLFQTTIMVSRKRTYNLSPCRIVEKGHFTTAACSIPKPTIKHSSAKILATKQVCQLNDEF